jgi:hypothetical protein
VIIRVVVWYLSLTSVFITIKFSEFDSLRAFSWSWTLVVSSPIKQTRCSRNIDGSGVTHPTETFLEVMLGSLPKHWCKWRCAHNQNINGSNVTQPPRTLMEVTLRTQLEHWWKWRYAPNRNIVGSCVAHTTRT